MADDEATTMKRQKRLGSGSLIRKIAKHVGLRRHHLASARMWVERNVLASNPFARTRQRARILCYHSIGQTVSGVNDVRPAQFRRHIELALQSGFQFVPASKIARSGGSPEHLAITFDDGWASVLTQAAPVLRDYSVPWSLFIVSTWSDHALPWTKDLILPWRDIHSLMQAGAEIGSHSATHPDFGSIGRLQIIDELYGSRDTIEKHLGVAPKAFAIPLGGSGNWTPVAAKIAQEAGYELVYAQAEEARPNGSIPRTFVSCFDSDRIFTALLAGAYDCWEEWV